MTTNDIYKVAAKNDLTFTTPFGLLVPSDLYKISMEKLDSIAVGLKKQINSTVNEESFLGEKKVDPLTQLRFDIALDTIKTRQEDIKNKENAASKSREKRELENLLAEMEVEERKKLSKEEIQKKLDELG